MRRWNKVIFLGVTCLVLAGCGKNRGDELSKDYQRNDALEGDVSAESESVTGHLEYELISDSGITFTVDADATGGGKLAESHCYGAKPVEVDEAYLKEHVYTIFDEGTLQHVKPYEVCSQQELANRQNQLLQRQQELQLQTDTENSSVHAIWENGIQSDLETEDWLADQRDESMVTEETGKAIYTYEIADGITTSLARVDGEIDEIPYVYTCAYYDSNAYPYSRMRYMRYDMYSYEAKITVRPKTEEDAVEGLDIREAEAKADAFLAKLGYDDFTCFETGIGAKLVANEDAASMNPSTLNDCAYCFSYTRTRDGIPVAGTPGAYNFTFGIANQLPASEEVITVAVDVDGVAVADIQSAPYDVEETGIGIESVLTLEQVDAAAQNYMQKFEKTNAYADVHKIMIDRVELNYVYVCYTDGKCNVIPIWAYYGSTREGGKERYLFGVSAVDGQIVEGQYMYYLDLTFTV